MNYLYITLTLVYIIDISGFTDAWRGLVARMVHIPERQLRPLKPFDCSTCMCFWINLIYALATGEGVIISAVIAAFAAFCAPIASQAILLIKETILCAISDLFQILERRHQ